MKTIEIIGDNYFGQCTKTRTACRVLVQEGGRLLLSYETKTGQWMIPGGGVEPGESETGCCVRETEEETGLRVLPGECFLEIDEYYEHCRWVSRYYTARVTGEGRQRLTPREQAAGTEPRWLPEAQAADIFSRHAMYDGIDEMRRGLYLREYTALRAWEEYVRDQPPAQTKEKERQGEQT